VVTRNTWIFIFLLLTTAFWLLAGLLSDVMHGNVSVACSFIGLVYAVCAVITRFTSK